MKYRIAFLLIISTVFSIDAQSLSNEVIGTSGADFSVGTAKLAWTIGEPVINSLSAGNFSITQGFHQPYITVSSVEQNDIFDVKVFPNPTHDKLNVVFDSDEERLLEVFDVLGRKLHEISFSDNSILIDINAYSCGNYLLRISESGRYQTFKIQKIR